MTHNGGRSQLNFHFLQIGNDYPFLNHVKTGQRWTLTDESGPPVPSNLNSNGYPISGGGVYTVFGIPSQSNRPGNWVIDWIGDGSIRKNFSHTVVSGSASGVNGRCVVAPTVTRIDLGISTFNASNPITQLRFYHVDDESSLNAGNVFTALFKQKLTDARIGVLRFLDWQYGNTSIVTKWKHRKPTAFPYYDGAEARAELFGGVTTNSGDDYSVAAPSDWNGLEDKAIVILQFNASAAGDAPTLNVGGTGAKNIKSQRGNAINAAVRPLINKYATLVFDADLDCWLKCGGDTADGDQFLNNGVPPEICLQLCEEVGAHPWWVQPYLTTDPITDYMSELASYSLGRSSSSWMIPRYESINEQWNPGAGFYGTAYGWNKANAHWGTTQDTHNFHGKILSLLGQQISTVYGGDRSKYQVICGVQTFGNIGGATNDRLNSSKYVTVDGGSAAKNWATHVACATYYSPTYSAAEANAAATEYAAADEAGKLVIATAYANSVTASGVGTDFQFGLPNIATLYASWYAWAVGFGLQLTAYEGGYSPDYVTGQTDLNSLKAGSKLVASLYDHTLTNYNNFLNAGGAFPSCYEFSGANVAWSVHDPNIYATVTPQWDAIVAFNATVAVRHYPSRVKRRKYDPDWWKNRPRTFTRAYFNELKAAEAVERAARERAERIKARQAKQALAKAAREAAQAIARAKEEQFDISKMTTALQAATGASSLAETIQQAQLAIQYAQEIMDEDEMIPVLLLH